MADSLHIDWKLIPKAPDGPTGHDAAPAPFDGGEYLLYADSATVDVVRLGWWNPGGLVDAETGEIIEARPDDRGWWSYRHSVTQEHLDFLSVSHWARFERPTEDCA
jgi:hypothetical protein